MSIMVNQEELELFRDNVRRFIQKEISPNLHEWERSASRPRELWNLMGENGLLCIDQSEEHGGSGAPFHFSFVVLEELSRAGSCSLASGVSIHSDIVAPYISHLGTEAQKQKWLPKMATGEVVGALGMTEPNAGSDLAAIRTFAEPKGDGWVLNGSKIFITNGIQAGVVIVAAKTQRDAGAKGISLFLVDTTAEGFRRGRALEKIGHHSQDTAELFFDNIELGPDALLGELNKGFAHMMTELPRERLAIAISAVGSAEFALEETVKYVTERKAFGSPISTLQNTRFKLAEVQTDIAINRAYTEKCMDKYAAGKMDVTEAAIVKLATTEMQGRVVDTCLQLFGGYGYMQEYPISRAYVDARIQRIYGGSSEIMKEVIARSLVGR